jgi:hypothetical protein
MVATGGFRAVLGNFEPAPAEARFHQNFLDRLLADAMIVRPPSREATGEDVKGMRDGCLHANGLAHWRDGDRIFHAFLSFLFISSRSTSD